MNLHKGMTITPKVSDRYYDPTDKRIQVRTRNAEKEDLHIGDTYNGLPIVGETDLLYICRHESGWTESFPKLNHRLGIKEEAWL